ncbi:DUF1223 domain-containing protein [Pararhizobium haloflavum]|uniref:DUF1223 domain-containing protein n=1 Tax=Pararhizobium haloflavum TaxID=2037914 RepID=UPI001FE030A4|nr:DUF1223 domain-containing protein [Pararhizobium haloflavum]
MLFKSVIPAVLIAISTSLTMPKEAAAEDHTPIGVVELFTSQGCSSCPPADAVLADIAADGEILALSYHVDYWNYLGWKDTLATPDNSQRQHAYAKMLERKSVYTPQAVINGRTHLNGSDKNGIMEAVDTMRREEEGMRVDVSIDRSSDSLTIEVEEGSGKANLVLLVFDRENVVAIDEGENSGRAITYVNSVRSIHVVGIWKGKPLTLELPASIVEDWSTQNCAVLVQTMVEKGVPGPIIGAATF